jgi:hypothetical protein
MLRRDRIALAGAPLHLIRGVITAAPVSSPGRTIGSSLGHLADDSTKAYFDVTARRQKHNGMSWSKAGSHALTALNAVVLNGGVQRWVRQREIALEFVSKAA